MSQNNMNPYPQYNNGIPQNHDYKKPKVTYIPGIISAVIAFLYAFLVFAGYVFYKGYLEKQLLGEYESSLSFLFVVEVLMVIIAAFISILAMLTNKRLILIIPIVMYLLITTFFGLISAVFMLICVALNVVQLLKMNDDRGPVSDRNPGHYGPGSHYNQNTGANGFNGFNSNGYDQNQGPNNQGPYMKN